MFINPSEISPIELLSLQGPIKTQKFICAIIPETWLHLEVLRGTKRIIFFRLDESSNSEIKRKLGLSYEFRQIHIAGIHGLWQFDRLLYNKILSSNSIELLELELTDKVIVS